VSQIHFIGGEKGGVGKSFFARLLCQWLIERRRPFAAIDADTSHESLARAYQEFTQVVDLERLESADEIMNRALGSDRRVVVDLPAQASRFLLRWLDSGEVLRFASEMGIPVTVFHVTDGSFDSVKALSGLLERFGSSVRYVVVKNLGRSRYFGLFDESEAQKRLTELGGVVFELRELDGASAHRVDRAGVSLWAAANMTEGEAALPPMDRQRLKQFLERSYADLDRIGDLL
jgi:hypothetical protein